MPGVQATGTTAASEQPQDIYRPTIGGQYWGGISFQLDGTDNRDSVLGEPVITPNLDSVSELKITTTAYDAEFGQASQAVISSHTKSGTNMLHGSGFEYRRDQHGAARDPFCAGATRLPARAASSFRPRCGTSSADRSAARSRRTRRSISAITRPTGSTTAASLLTRVPTAAERAGDLSGLNTPIFNPCNGTRLQHRSRRSASSSPATSSRRTCSRRRRRTC